MRFKLNNVASYSLPALVLIVTARFRDQDLIRSIVTVHSLRPTRSAQLTLVCSARRGEKLWIPKDNESQKNNEFVQDTFPSLGRFENVFIERKDGGNVLTPEAFDRALQLHNAIIETTWDNANDDGSRDIEYLPQPLKFSDLCLNRNSGEGVPEGEVLSCEMNNPLELFGYAQTAWATPADLLAGINTEATWDRELVSRGFVLDSVLGGIERNAADEIVSARVISLVYFLAGNQTLIDDQKDDEPAKAWEEQVLDLLEVPHPPSVACSAPLLPVPVGAHAPYTRHACAICLVTSGAT